MRYFLGVVALLHAGFMLAELFPSTPALLRIVMGNLPKDESFTPKQQKLVANIVRNAGIYNGIVAGGLLWAAIVWPAGVDVAHVMLAGAVVAGIFGAVTINPYLPSLQALLGAIGLFLLCRAG